MKRKRRVEIIFDASRTIVYASRYLRRTEWCPSCGKDVEMITTFEAARVAGVSSGTIYGQAEGGEIHSRVTREGVLLVCLTSLPI